MRERVLPPVVESRFRGMVANRDAYLGVGEVLWAENFWLDEGEWRPRLGLELPWAALDSTNVQGLVYWENLTGQAFVHAIVNGNVYEYDWQNDEWDQVILAGAVVSTSRKVRFCVSRGRLIVTDGLNKPWMLSISNTLTRTITLLEEAPIASHCTVYYDKVFFYDLLGDTIAFEWSDEGDPTMGYAYNDQVWEFAQTDGGSVVGMAALNNVLDIFKRDSATYITGAVDEDFRTAAVREGLSESEGTISADSIVIVDGDVYTLTRRGPRRVVQGESVQELFERVDDSGVPVEILRDVWSRVNRSAWQNSFGVFDSQRRHIWWFVPLDSLTQPKHAIVYDVDSGGFWFFSFPYEIRCATEAIYPDGSKVLLLGDASGRIFRYGADDNGWLDNDQAITYLLRSRLYGQTTSEIEKRLLEARINFVHHTPSMKAEMGWVRRTDDGLEDKGGKVFGVLNAEGRRLYRRGFNQTGKELGWYLRLLTAGEAASIRSAITTMSVVGSEVP